MDHGHHSGGDHEYVRRASPITPSRHIVHQVEATLAERYASMAYAFASAIPHMSLVGAKATTGVEAGGRRSEVNLLGNIQGVVHLNSEISDGAFQLGVSEEKLDCTQVAGLPINLASLGAAHRVRAVRR